MLEEHRDEEEKIGIIRAALEEPSSPDVQDRITSAGRYILKLLRNHIEKEDKVLFPLAEQTLTPEEKKRIKQDMDVIGNCCPECAQH